jgi:hypothetical protein
MNQRAVPELDLVMSVAEVSLSEVSPGLRGMVHLWSTFPENLLLCCAHVHVWRLT